ncbi:AAA family ATPase [candidate division CSSED10-310 bacterium]|uniref:AAA family ATPase n=1 Tax=candidate division CSSED10-310 bacterium TaxID=2855610 RepID=A0ABV6Z198_UNCC1
MSTTFPVIRVAEVPVTRQHRWLIRHLWSDQAVGIIGGPAKACKSWLGLEMAISVATGTDCLRQFPVETAGRVLIYMAEDALPTVRERIQALSRYRSIDLDSLPVYLIDTPSIRLDQNEHRARLSQTIKQLKPKLLLLDPLVRLHRTDENSAMEMARILGFLRELQRAYKMALVLVHHTSKKHHTHPGQALRGSSDIHAWTDSSLFVQKRGRNLVLTVEHRSAPAPETMIISLVQGAGNTATHLTVLRQGETLNQQRDSSLTNAIGELLKMATQPMTRDKIRKQLGVRNQSLGYALEDLEMKGIIRKTNTGWVSPEKAL